MLKAFTPPRYFPLYSHRPGIRGFLARTSYAVQAYPTACMLLQCEKEGLKQVSELVFPKLAPQIEWTAFFDTVHQIFLMQGKGRASFFRCSVEVRGDGIFFRSGKGPLEVVHNGVSIALGRGESVRLCHIQPKGPERLPRLSLGSNASPNWDRISYAPDMTEVLPLWYQFGRNGCSTREQAPSLLGCLADAVCRKDSLSIVPALEALFAVAVDDIFIPRLEDDRFLGYQLPPLSALFPLQSFNDAVHALLRALFLQEGELGIDLLPLLPKQFACGRLWNETLSSGHLVSLEWRKGRIRRVLLKAICDDSIHVSMGASRCRVYPLDDKRGNFSFASGDALHLQAGRSYLFDNFFG